MAISLPSYAQYANNSELGPQASSTIGSYYLWHILARFNRITLYDNYEWTSGADTHMLGLGDTLNDFPAWFPLRFASH